MFFFYWDIQTIQLRLALSPLVLLVRNKKLESVTKLNRRVIFLVEYESDKAAENED